MRTRNQPADRAAVRRQASIFIVDDHPIVRQGLIQLINHEPDLRVCGEAETAAAAWTAIERIEPDLVVIDVSLKGTSGIELVKQIHRGFRGRIPMLVLSMHDEALYAERALRAGARGYVMKQEGTEKLLEAIRKVLRGELHLSESAGARVVRKLVGATFPATQCPVSRLTDRELEIFQLIGQGRSTAQIAEQLSLSGKTIQSHREHIKRKLNIQGRAELAWFAMDWVREHT